MKMILFLILSTLSLFTFAIDAQSIDSEALYQDFCSVCHGDKGDGNSHARQGMVPPPRDFTSLQSAIELDRARILLAIRDGVPATAMIGWKSRLSEPQITALADFIRTKFMLPVTVETATAESTDADMSLPFPDNLQGDLNRGTALYMANCSICHGVEGDGRGPRAHFIYPKPRDFLHTASRTSFNRPTLFKAISKGKIRTEMPAWEKVLSEQQIADVSEFVFDIFINP